MKLNSKDLISVGVFTAMYLLVIIVISGLVITPVLQIMMMPLMALFTGPVYLLYLAKVGKFGSVMITGLLGSAIVGLLVYGNVYCFLVNMIFFVIAEFIAFAGKYKNNKLNQLSFIVVSFWTIGEAGLPWAAGKYFYDLSIKSGYTVEWADGVDALATPLNLGLMVAGVIVCSIISILFSNKLFKKHFKKAGLV